MATPQNKECTNEQDSLRLLMMPKTPPSGYSGIMRTRPPDSLLRGSCIHAASPLPPPHGKQPGKRAKLFTKPLLSGWWSVPYVLPASRTRARFFLKNIRPRCPPRAVGVHPLPWETAPPHRGKTLDPACVGTLPAVLRAGRNHRRHG